MVLNSDKPAFLGPNPKRRRLYLPIVADCRKFTRARTNNGHWPVSLLVAVHTPLGAPATFLFLKHGAEHIPAAPVQFRGCMGLHRGTRAKAEGRRFSFLLLFSAFLIFFLFFSYSFPILFLYLSYIFPVFFLAF
jgi:hypothetical protein